MVSARKENWGRYLFTNRIIGLFVFLCCLVSLILISCSQEPPHVHDYKLIKEVLPSCVEDGYDIFVCDCGETKSVVLPKTGQHTPAEGVKENVVESTCSEKGHYDYVVYCSVCKQEISRETRLTELTDNHLFNCQVASQEYLASAATCTEPAVYYYSCKCGEIGTEMFYYGKALGHKLIHHVAKAGSCTEVGWNEYDTCTRCDYSTYEEIAADHEFTMEFATSEYLKTPATCTEPAQYYKSCVCGAKGNETFSYGEPLGHDLSHFDGQEASCEYFGWKPFDVCSRCDYNTYEEIPAGHKFVLEIATEEHLKKPATCSDGAEYYKSCECGENGTETFFYGDTSGLHDDVNGYCSLCGRKNTVSSYRIEVPPTKTTYLYGTAFDPTGLVLKLVKENGEELYVASGYTYDETVTVGTGNQKFPIHYTLDDTDYVFYQNIEVTPITPVSLTIFTGPNKTTYYTYEQFNKTGLSFFLRYDNSLYDKIITSGYTVVEPSHATGGMYSVVFKYTENNKTVSCSTEIHVVDVVPARLELLTEPTKTEYYINESFDPTGIVLKVINNDGTTKKIVSTGFEYPTEPLYSDSDEVIVPVSYTIEGVKLNLNLGFQISARTPMGLEIVSNPDKTSYYHGEAFDPTGLVLRVIYDDNPTSLVIYDRFLIEEPVSFTTQSGVSEFTITYEENGQTVSCNCPINVSHKFDHMVCAPMHLVDNTTSDLEATYYYSCACGYVGEDVFVHKHSFSENDVCTECGFICKDIHLFTISNTTLTGLAVQKSDVSGDISIPKGIQSISSSVFSNCTNLTGVIIPDSVTSIGTYLLSGCTSLSSITIPFVGNGSTNLFFGYLFGNSRNYSVPISVENVTITGGDSISDDAFSDCDRITSITIPDSVTNIGDSAFYNCKGLISITIPDSVKSIGDYAFYSCENITSITIPDSIATIGNYAFYNCKGLTSIIIHDSVTHIGKQAFDNCRSATNMSFRGAIDQWNSIQKGYNCVKFVRTIHCSDGDIELAYSFSVGDLGPAGGYIFYDCDADNDSGNADGLISSEVGWRYLEAAPADLRLINGIPTVDSTLQGYSSGTYKFFYGFYRLSDTGNELCVNGTTTYNSANCTGRVIGTGKRNTQLLVNTMGDEPYKNLHNSDDNAEKISDYASKMCDILTFTIGSITYDDWFLPSKDELNLLYKNLKTKGLGGLASDHYWSSSEMDDHYVWLLYFKDGEYYAGGRYGNYRIRPIRAF